MIKFKKLGKCPEDTLMIKSDENGEKYLLFPYDLCTNCGMCRDETVELQNEGCENHG